MHAEVRPHGVADLLQNAGAQADEDDEAQPAEPLVPLDVLDESAPAHRLVAQIEEGAHGSSVAHAVVGVHDDYAVAVLAAVEQADEVATAGRFDAPNPGEGPGDDTVVDAAGPLVVDPPAAPAEPPTLVVLLDEVCDADDVPAHDGPFSGVAQDCPVGAALQPFTADQHAAYAVVTAGGLMARCASPLRNSIHAAPSQSDRRKRGV